MFIPVVIIFSILLIIVVLLIIADKVLVSYGECKISIKKEDEEKEFTVQGGGNLLSAMITNGISISAPCGGRGSCGYCKVQMSSGGGEMLPTEELFISKEEEKLGTRLACQVKVKENLQLYIPDLITSVKSMVKAGTIDTKMKWKFLRKDRPQVLPKSNKFKKLPKNDRTVVDDIVEKYRDMRGNLMPVLQAVNEQFKYLPEPILRDIAKEMNVPLSNLFRIATFYNTFSLKPRGKYIISVCTGTACHVKGAADVLECLKENLGVNPGETTEDKEFTLDAVRCIGCCGLAPVLTINEDVHGLLTTKKVPELIDMYKGK